MNRILDYVTGLSGLLVACGLVGWGFWRMLKASYDPVKILLKLAFTAPFVIASIWFAHLLGPFGPFLIVAMAVVLSIIWTPHLADWISSPITGLFDGGTEAPEAKPFYSIATTQRKRGNYDRAIAEIRKQLTKFPDDFEGYNLLASIQAENLRDLVAAENTLEKFCARKNSTDKQVAVAWTTMADWHLSIGLDADAARASLDKILQHFPETELALHAEQRLAHIGDAEKTLLGARDPKRIAVPQGIKNLGLMDGAPKFGPKEIEPGRLAAAHVKHLQAHPNDAEVREKLATIYARDFKRLDLATMELTHLINEPRHAPKQIAGWLNLLANFQVELGADVETVRETLETIVKKFPDLPIAEITQRRLARLNNEFKGLKQNEGVKLGNYEQNIGLKYGKPGKHQ